MKKTVKKTVPYVLLELMAGGGFVSGELIGEKMGISRAAVWKQLQLLQDLGIHIESVKGKGYRLLEPVSVLQEPAIRAMLPASVASVPLCLFDSIDSTNAEAQRNIAAVGGDGGDKEAMLVILAEGQTQGRGRRGKSWFSPFAANIYMTLVRRCEGLDVPLGGLSLAVGIALVDAFEQLGLPDAKLKWPNDVLYDNKKLAGVLIEVVGDPAGQCHLVIGVGVNVNMQQSQGEIDQSWVSMQQISQHCYDRNAVAAQIISQLNRVVLQFEREGFAPFKSLWSNYDAYLGEEVLISMRNETLAGKVAGVSDHGELLLHTASGVQAFSGGHVSLRCSV